MCMMMTNGWKKLPALVESNDYLAAKLSIPLSTIFEEK